MYLYDSLVFLIVGFLPPKEIIRSRRVSKIFDVVYNERYKKSVYKLSVTGMCRYYNQVYCAEGQVLCDYFDNKLLYINDRYFKIIDDDRAIFVGCKYVILFVPILGKYIFQLFPSNRCDAEKLVADSIKIWDGNFRTRVVCHISNDVRRYTLKDIVHTIKDLDNFYLTMEERSGCHYFLARAPKRESVSELAKAVNSNIVEMLNGRLTPIG